MSNVILEEEVRDTNVYTGQDIIGNDDPSVVYQMVNELDAEVDVTFYGDNDLDSDPSTDAVEIGSYTVAAGDSIYDTLTDSWDMIHVEVQAAVSPTSGDVTVYGMYNT